MLEQQASNVFICSVEISTTANLLPSLNLIPSDNQQFFNSDIENDDFITAYSAISAIQFTEESKSVASGTIYEQKLQLKFNEADFKRSNRLAFIHQLSFVKINLTNSLSFLIGRNDEIQNTKPKVKSTTKNNQTVIEIDTISIFPTGFISLSNG